MEQKLQKSCTRPLPCKAWYYREWNRNYKSLLSTYSMQDLIAKGMQQKIKKSCVRRNKNTWHVESNQILKHPKYLLLIVNRLRYTNKNVTKDRCSIPLDTTLMLGTLKFILRATIDHSETSILHLSIFAKRLLQQQQNDRFWNYW